MDEELPEFRIGREGRTFSLEELEERFYSHPALGDARFEVIDGQLGGTHEGAVAMLGVLLEACGTDAAVRLGDPEVWREAVEDLYRER